MDFSGFNLVGSVVEPVSVDEVKGQLRLDGGEQDNMLVALIASARGALERYLHRSIARGAYVQSFDCFGDVLELLRPPCVSVESIHYESGGVKVLLDSGAYRVDLDSTVARLSPAVGRGWPSTDGVTSGIRVAFTAGYSAETLPAPLRQAVIMLAVDLFEHPEANVELNLRENRSYKFLLAGYKLPIL